ncbi:acyl-CoA dehydrogenase family protein [Colwellia sp. MB02u-18]|uniref:acyl-CoA dehydrogenase family protein n=1 Tax=unclassified Colwellia TaxID=196834 RepID=UPI0015F66656|nr:MULTISPECIES: acyl-CoA dehydrogenase family protein [unclassified Colwellia]MBA6222590.1 acyl-CoA dehydrogenase family protein [Colwellia sp. MB3u-45]MBA6266477.1 acyl-CoA dehydrogenase family protein [Colwellia sp. MB3u-43]MBA6320238.1 acyl-CoA dehydrogenase family protein [Colwellia sp. MB02u-19]MBA6323480.1 acyl-CoA dehydrogenase family protein [Colwellia sp. MB02u-18]MBA6329770.1 acyl-CoA dehydrogenase family protein [Colwellia sp. MB02u-12]
MDLSLTEEQIMIQDMARKFANSELAPVAAQLDETRDQSLFLKNLAQLNALGFMGLNIKAEYGGVEAGSVAFSLAITELARACASTAVTTSVTNMVAEVIQAVGNDEQKSKYLPKICSGEYRAGGFCLSEAAAGSDPAGMKTQAVKDGDDYLISGSKIYITSGSFADVFVVWAVTDPAAKKGKGISCFIVEAGTAGMTIGKSEEKMGQKASPTNEVHFDRCRVPASAMMGAENKGFGVAVGELAGGRIGIGSLALGIGLAALDYAKAHIIERKQFGQSLSNFQGLQWTLAERYTEMEAARLLLMQAAYTKDQGQPFGMAASMAKLFAAEKANKACYDALQLMGGAGYIREYPLERMARDVRVTSIYEGTSEIQKVIIARELLQKI